MALVIEDRELREVQLSEAELRLEIAILLYQQERLSLGKAGRFAGMNRILFQKELGKRKIAVNYDLEEFDQDLTTLGIKPNTDYNHSPLSSLSSVSTSERKSSTS